MGENRHHRHAVETPILWKNKFVPQNQLIQFHKTTEREIQILFFSRRRIQIIQNRHTQTSSINADVQIRFAMNTDEPCHNCFVTFVSFCFPGHPQFLFLHRNMLCVRVLYSICKFGLWKVCLSNQVRTNCWREHRRNKVETLPSASSRSNLGFWLSGRRAADVCV